MIDLLIYIFIGYACFQLARFILDAWLFKNIEQDFKQFLNKIVREVTIEKNGSMEYWFDKETNEFYAQGKTLDEIIDVLKSRFPKHIFLLPSGILSGPEWKVKENLEEANIKNYFSNER